MKRSLQVWTVGSMIGLSTISPFAVGHTQAESVAVAVNSARLTALEVEEFELDQTFSQDVLNYEASVANDVDHMSLLLESESDMTVNGTPVISGKATDFELATGENVFTIKVTGQTETTYTIKVVRAENNNTLLSGIKLSSGALTFTSDVNTYSIDVGNQTNSLTVLPTAAAKTSTVQVNGKDVGATGVKVELPVGRSTIAIVVTAETGNQKTYLVSVGRAESKTSTGNTPSSQAPAGGDSSTSAGNDSGAGAKPSSLSNSSASALTGAGASSAVRTASTSGSSGTEGVGETTTANLASLAVSTGTWDTTFDSDIYTYHLAVGVDVTTTTITAGAENSAATVKVDGVETTSRTVTLANRAKQAVSVVVTNGDDKKTYVLIFEKAISTSADDVVAASESVTEITSKAESSDLATSQAETTRANLKSGTRPTTTEEDSSSFWDWLKSLFGF